MGFEVKLSWIFNNSEKYYNFFEIGKSLLYNLKIFEIESEDVAEISKIIKKNKKISKNEWEIYFF